MHKKICRTLLAALLVCVLGVRQAYAWHSVGHMAVAYIAYQQLTPKTRARVAVLLKKNPYYKKWLAFLPAGTTAADRDLYLFMMAATWPDEIKAQGSGYVGGGPNGGDTPPKDMAKATRNVGYTDMDMHKYWHFVDHPFTTDGSVLPSLPVPNSETQIAAFRATLSSKASDNIKSYDLVWVEHLVGDAHQPLHNVTRVTMDGDKNGDGGGNDVQITGPGNLHTYWDDVPGTGDTADFVKAATYAKSLPPAPDAPAADTNVDDWVTESVNLAETQVYSAPVGPGVGPYVLNDAYKTQAQAAAQLRIALAGARLAKLLNDNLR